MGKRQALLGTWSQTALITGLIVSMLAAAQGATLQVVSQLAAPGEIVDVPVNYASQGALGVAVQADVDYPASQLGPNALPASVGNTHPFFTGPTPVGKLRWLLGTQPLADKTLRAIPDGGSARLQFKVFGTGSRLITASGFVLADATANALPITGKAGVVADPNDLVTDSDNDGIPDSWEVSHGLDPLNAADASQDPDHDGVTNLNEFRNGTSPFLSGNERELSNRLLVWAKTLPGMGDVTVVKMTVAADGSLYLLGTTRGATDFDPSLSGEHPVDTHVSTGFDAIHVTKINPDSTYAWTQVVTSSGFLSVGGITADASGNVYFTGGLSGDVTWPDGQSINANEGLGKWFVASFNAQGTARWLYTWGDLSMWRDGV